MSIKAKLNIALKTLYNNRANIAFYGGTALTMIGTGLFVHATRKNEPVITDHKLAMALVSEDDKQTKRDICKKTVKETAKNYALPVAVSGIGYAFTFYGNITLTSYVAIKQKKGLKNESSFLKNLGVVTLNLTRSIISISLVPVSLWNTIIHRQKQE